LASRWMLPEAAALSKRPSVCSMSALENWKHWLCLSKIITAMSQSHKTASSLAFLSRPFFRFMNVTCRFRASGIGLIVIFLRSCGCLSIVRFAQESGNPLGH
jgi:hypothetical protein